MPLIPDSVGWAATAVFAASYFCKSSGRLRAVQAAAAWVWMAYGVLIHSLPVIVSNGIVSSLALYSAWRGRRRGPAPAGAASGAPAGIGAAGPEHAVLAQADVPPEL